MKSFRLYIRLLLACALLVLPATTVSAKDKWINLTTKNFNIISNADEGDTRQLALKLEQFQAIVSKLFNIKTVAWAPVTVIVFKSDSSFKPFKPLYNGKPRNISGYFQPGEDENLIALNISANEQHPLAIILHEYTHLLTSFTPRDWPLWLKEGIAELYSTFDVKNKEVTIGSPISSHVYLLRDNKFIPLQSLFSVGHDSPAYNERDKQGIFYAESWALAHYLVFGNKSARQRQLLDFVKRLEEGASIDQAFAAAFQTDHAALEKELRRYIGNTSYPAVVYTLNSTEGDKAVSLRPLEEAEVQFHLGNLLMRTQRMDEAEACFKQALAINPNLARAYEGLGFIAMRRNKYDEAKEHFKQAVARDSKNHLAHYYYADSLLREAAGSVTPELGKKITESLRTSIKLMPRFAQAYYLMGVVSLVTGENLQEGAQMVNTALRLAPQNKHYLLTMAQLQVRLQDYAGAKKTLEPLLAADSNPGLKHSAESIMSMIEIYTRPYSARSPNPEETVSDFPATKEAAQREELKSTPRLKRKGEPDENSESSGKRPGHEQPRAERERAPTGIGGRPTLKIAGAQVIEGVLAAIECDSKNFALVVRTQEKLVRFVVSDYVGLQFYSQDPKFEGSAIRCGSVNKKGFIYYKPMTGGQSKFAGDAVAVEFIRQQ